MGILDELDEAALVEILTKPRNAIMKQYQRLFDYEGVKLTFTDEATRAVAQEALLRKVGARGLRMILEELMLDLMYHLPSNKKIKELEIQAEMVQKPQSLDHAAGQGRMNRRSARTIAASSQPRPAD